MKNVIIIAGSPRVGGNTEALVKEFARGAKEAGNKVSVVSLAKDKVAPCTGCYVCQSPSPKGSGAPGKCWQKDKADAILKKMQKADVIVFASPVYFYSISAQLKALFDRSVVIYPNLENKQYYFLMAMADTNRKMFDAWVLRGMNPYGSDTEGLTAMEFAPIGLLPHLIRTYGMSPNHKSDAGETPLRNAILDQDVDKVRVLIREGSDVNRYHWNWGSLLNIAIRFGYDEIANVLLGAGAVNRDRSGRIRPLPPWMKSPAKPARRNTANERSKTTTH